MAARQRNHRSQRGDPLHPNVPVNNVDSVGQQNASHEKKPWWHKALSWTAVAMLVWVAVPTISVSVMCSPLQRGIVYLNWMKNPFTNLTDVSAHGFGHTVENFVLTHPDGNSTVRGWHIPPAEGDLQLTEQSRVVLYLHGNAGTRGAQHRLDLYDLLRTDFSMHVVTFDYRGYADTQGTPTESGLVDDAVAVWEWIQTHGVPNDNITLWGHSLGSGVATSLAHRLQSDTNVSSHPFALVLEAPFTSLAHGARSHPFSAPVRVFWPIGMAMIEECLGPQFHSASKIGKLDMPTLILHGTGDIIIDASNGVALHDIARRERARPESVHLAMFNKVGHDNICYDPELVNVLTAFWANASQM